MNKTTQTFSEKEDSTDHAHTYIHTYMEKRKRTTTTTNTNIIFYDGKDLEEIKEIAFRNKTNVSSIVSNLSREFALLFKSKTPQKTLFNFGEEESIVDFNYDSKTWESIIRESTPEEKEKIKNQIIIIDKLLGRYL